MFRPLLLLLITVLIGVLLSDLIYFKLDQLHKKQEGYDEKLKQIQEQLNQNQTRLELQIKEATRSSFLNRYFRAKNSPLSEHAADFIAAADYYRIDPLLVPAIAMAESGGCRAYPPGSYNCWGWGAGGGRPGWRFLSYREAIFTISRSLGTSPLYRQYQETRSVVVFASIYNKPYQEDYSRKISYFMNEIKKYE